MKRNSNRRMRQPDKRPNKTHRIYVKGVGKSKGTNPKADLWFAHIKINGHGYRLGVFKGIDEAVLHIVAVEQCMGMTKNSQAYKFAVRRKLIKEYDNTKIHKKVRKPIKHISIEDSRW